MYRSVICLWLFLAGMGSLLAIGYTSALVTTEDEYLAATKDIGDNAPPPAVPNTVGLATGGMAPMADTTTRLVYGLTDAILSRFKQQLFISAVVQWRNALLESEVSYFFPNLAQTLQSVDPQSFQTSYRLWQQAIEQDLIESPLGILNYTVQRLESSKSIKIDELAMLKELRVLLSDFYALRKVSNLHEFIVMATDGNSTHSPIFRLIGHTAKNMMDRSGELAIADLNTLFENSDKRDRYIEIVNQDIKDLRLFGDSLRITSTNYPAYQIIAQTVSDFFEKTADSGSDTITTEEGSTGKLDHSKLMSLYLNTCDKVMVQFYKLAATPNPPKWDIYYSTFIKHRLDLVEIAKAAEAKNYKALLNRMIVTATKLATPDDPRPGSYGRFLNLIAAVAQSSEDDKVSYRELMNSVLEPVGTYTYKRSSAFTLGINAYPGLGAGAEMLEADLDKAKGVGGLASPVGLELSWGRGLLGLRGIFFSALDLGAIATYRFSGETDASVNSPQVGWKQLVSPGVYLLVQGKSHPLTLGFGAQLTPELRKVDTAGKQEDKNALRLGAFLSVDIPLLTLYVKHNWFKGDNYESRAPRTWTADNPPADSGLSTASGN